MRVRESTRPFQQPILGERRSFGRSRRRRRNCISDRPGVKMHERRCAPLSRCPTNAIEYRERQNVKLAKTQTMGYGEIPPCAPFIVAITSTCFASSTQPKSVSSTPKHAYQYIRKRLLTPFALVHTRVTACELSYTIVHNQLVGGDVSCREVVLPAPTLLYAIVSVLRSKYHHPTSQ